MKPYIIIVSLLCTLLAACTKTDEGPAAITPEEYRVAISVGIKSPALPTLSRRQSTFHESLVEDVNLYALHIQTGITRHVYFTRTAGTVLSLIPGEWDLYAIANTGRDMGPQTLEDLETLQSDAFREQVSGAWNGIPMSARKRITVSGDTSVTLELVRLVARLQLRVEIAPNMKERITVSEVQMLSAPVSVGYFTEGVSDKFTDYSAVAVTDETFTCTYYPPENLAGTVPEITRPQERSITNAPTNATCIVIEATCDSRPVTYYLYPGENDTSDFNIRRNHDYILNVTLCGANPEDIRLATYDLTLADTEGRANVGSAFNTTLDFAAINLKGEVFRFSFRSLQSGCNVSVDGQAVAPGPFATLTADISASRSFEIRAESAEAGTAQIEFTVSNGRGENLTRTLTIEFLVPEQIDISPTYSYGLTAKELSSVTSELHASVSFSILVSKPLPGPLTIGFDYRWGSKYTDGNTVTDNRYSDTLEVAAGVRGSGVELFNGDKQGEPCPVYNTSGGYYTRHGYTMLSGGSLHITYLSDPPPGYVYNLKPVNVVYRNPVK